MPSNIGKSEKTLVNIQNSQQNKQHLNSFDSGQITMEQNLCISYSHLQVCRKDRPNQDFKYEKHIIIISLKMHKKATRVVF